MINSLIEWSLNNRILVIALYLAIAAWGYWALLATPIDAIPDLSDNQVIVFTDWAGRSPQEVEDQVTYPLVTSLQGLPGVRVVRANSAFSFSMVNVIFEDDVELYWARTRILETASRRRHADLGTRRYRRRASLLVHARIRRNEFTRFANDSGLVRPLPA
jgi:copper/silver efflux system protein